MADKSFKDYVIIMLLAGLFVVALTTFGSMVATSYETELSIDDEQLDLTTLESELDNAGDNAESWEETFRSDNPFVATGALIMFGFWGVIKLMWNAVGVIFNVLLGGLSEVIGLDLMVTGTLLSILIIGLIFAAWRAIKSGN